MKRVQTYNIEIFSDDRFTLLNYWLVNDTFVSFPSGQVESLWLSLNEIHVTSCCHARACWSISCIIRNSHINRRIGSILDISWNQWCIITTKSFKNRRLLEAIVEIILWPTSIHYLSSSRSISIAISVIRRNTISLMSIHSIHCQMRDVWNILTWKWKEQKWKAQNFTWSCKDGHQQRHKNLKEMINWISIARLLWNAFRLPNH